MSSDEQNPLNQTGSGFPTIGRIKRVGEASTPPQEQVSSSGDGSDYFQNSGNEEQQDYFEPQEAEPSIVAPPPKPPGLRLQKNNAGPAPTDAPQSPGIKVKNRTMAQLDHEERAQKTIAQFDDYFQQEEEKNQFNFLAKIFPLENVFSDKARKIILGTTILCLIVGIVFSLSTFWLNLFFALISVQAVLILSLQKFTLQKLGLFPSRIIFCTILSLAFIAVPIFYNFWQKQGVSYVQGFKNVENIANQAQEKIKEGVKSASAEVAEDVVTHDFQYSGSLAEKFHDKTYLSTGELFRMYFQYVFLIFGFILIPFIKERELFAVQNLKADDSKIFWSVASYFTIRFVKAILVTTIIAIGLASANIDNVIFISGITLILAFLTKFGPSVAILMCIPSIISNFNSGSGTNCLIALGITAAIAFFVETRFYLFVRILPFKDKSFIPVSLTQPKPAVVKVDGGGTSIFNYIGTACNLLLIALVAFAGWKSYIVWADNDDVNKDIPVQVQKAAGENKALALSKLEKYRQKNPYNQEIIYEMTKAYGAAGEFSKTFELAKAYRDFKAPEPDAKGIIELGEQHILKILSNSNSKAVPNKALIWLVSNFHANFKSLLDKQEVLTLIDEMIKTDPKFMRSYELGANHAFLNKNYEAVRTWCQKGLEVTSDNVELLKFIVKTYIAEDNKIEALKASMNVAKATTSDPEADELMKQINQLSDPNKK